MTYRTIKAADWIDRQPEHVQEVGKALGEEIVRKAGLNEPLLNVTGQDALAGPNGS